MNPYLITGPALISFSGGRTSAFMLRNILDAHGGHLPPDVKVTFANTGKEREETLRFVYDCETHWGAKVHWLEWRDSDTGFEEVGYNSASRKGEPFAALIAEKNYLPNSVTRFCTSELKIRVMRDFAKAQGWKKWINAVGLRYDEGHRVFKALARNDSGNEPFKAVMPMSKAKHTKADVLAYWAHQPFDLQLRHYEGNCDLCFLKGRKKLAVIIREQPGMADWWIEQERLIDATFNRDRSYKSILKSVSDQPILFEDDGDYDVECGLTCDVESEA